MYRIVPLALLPVALMLAGCDIVPLASETEPRNVALVDATDDALDPGRRAVRIGEDGSAAPACAIRGVVTNLSDGATLPLYTAPFAHAATAAELAEGQQLFVCTRSIDQRWLGVVVPTGGDTDCGVTGRIERAGDYAGPCRSGWVSFTYVRVRGA